MKQYAESTVRRLRRLAFRGCADPGDGGCIPRCEACRAKEKLRATDQLYDRPERPDWVLADK